MTSKEQIEDKVAYIADTLKETFMNSLAYKRMLFRAKDGEEERVWNSRDGATPFQIKLRSGKDAVHVEHHRDEFIYDYVPSIDSRIFVNLTPRRAWEISTKLYTDSDQSVYRSIFHMLNAHWPETPDIIVVDKDTRETFAERALALEKQAYLLNEYFMARRGM